MKKYILFLCLPFLSLAAVYAQCVTNVTEYWSTPCNGTASVSGQAGLSMRFPDNTYGPCSGSSVTVQLQRLNGSTWSVQYSTIVNSNASPGNYSFSNVASGTYRIVGIPSGGICSGCPTLTRAPQTITTVTPASASFKVDGFTVNPNTYTNVYDCSASFVQMTDIVAAGTSASFGYQYKVHITKVGSPTVFNGNWMNGAPPATLPLRTYIGLAYGSTTGQFTVTLSVKNNCNPAGMSYVGKIQVNVAPTAATACIQLANNSLTGCTGSGVNLVNLGADYNSATSTCANSPKINASCSSGQWVNGGWQMIVFEFDANGNFSALAINTPDMPLNNTADISCLNLNDLTNGYFFNNPPGYRYFVIFSVWNSCNANNRSVSSGWFRDNSAGCKNDEEELTGIEDTQAPTLNVYPNPASNQLNITWDYTEGGASPSVKLFSMDGKHVSAPVQSSGTGNMTLDVSGLQKGVYTLEFTDKTKHIKRIVIE